MNAKKDIQTLCIRILREPDEGKNGRELAIVQYIVGGQAYSPELTNREVYHDRIDRKRKYGKNKGLKWADVEYIRQNMPEILRLLSQPTFDQKRPLSGQEAAAGDTSNSDR